jgi:hypothetical protein
MALIIVILNSIQFNFLLLRIEALSYKMLLLI